MSMRFYKLGHMGVFSMKPIYNIQTIVHSYQLTWFHLLCLKREIKGLSASNNSQVIWKTSANESKPRTPWEPEKAK